MKFNCYLEIKAKSMKDVKDYVDMLQDEKGLVFVKIISKVVNKDV